jgi:hypothetical protein
MKPAVSKQNKCNRGSGRAGRIYSIVWIGGFRPKGISLQAKKNFTPINFKEQRRYLTRAINPENPDIVDWLIS